MERLPNPSRLQRLCTLVLCKWAHRVFFNKCKKGNEEQVMNWQTVFFCLFVFLGTLQWWKSWNNFSKHHWRTREQERKEVSQCFYLISLIELIWFGQLIVKVGRWLRRCTLSLANMDISVNMDATSYLICFHMFQTCAILDWQNCANFIYSLAEKTTKEFWMSLRYSWIYRRDQW